jgi:N-acyl-D-aspartate/D-glutamate deacylase
VGDLDGPTWRVIEANGLVVAPGFWDIHIHYYPQLLWDPLATSSSQHGGTRSSFRLRGSGIRDVAR